MVPGIYSVELLIFFSDFVINTAKFFVYLQMIIAGYILAVYQMQEEESTRLTPGNTPVRRRGGSQQSQQVHHSFLKDNKHTVITLVKVVNEKI